MRPMSGIWTLDCIIIVIMSVKTRESTMKENEPHKFRHRLLDRPANSRLRQEASRFRGKRFKELRKRYGSIVLGASLVAGGVGIPLKANRAAVPQPGPVTEIVGGVASGVESALSFREAESQIALLSEQAKEEFFRTQVPFGDLIYREALKNEVDPELVAAVVQQESRFKPTARSPVGAMGLMQLMPRTGKWMGATNLNDPQQNIKAGVKYLKYLGERFGDNETLILAAYNGGEGNVKRYGGVPPFRETRQYVKKVADYRADYEEKVAGKVAELVEESNPQLAQHLETPTR